MKEYLVYLSNKFEINTGLLFVGITLLTIVFVYAIVIILINITSNTKHNKQGEPSPTESKTSQEQEVNNENITRHINSQHKHNDTSDKTSSATKQNRDNKNHQPSQYSSDNNAESSPITNEPIDLQYKQHTGTEALPPPKPECPSKTTENLFTKYALNLTESLDHFPILRTPQKGCVVRSHRYGNTKRRGYKEASFQKTLQRYFPQNYEVSGEVRINTGKDTRPYEPDIAIIEKEQKYNLRIDVEIDEPYAGITRQSTHCLGEDRMRDQYFIERGWLVVRFSEYQVHCSELSCVKYIALLIKLIDSTFNIHPELIQAPRLNDENVWDTVQAQKWEKINYRETYLHHQFGEITEEKETIARGFNDQELQEEHLVTPNPIGTKDDGFIIAFNKKNAHPRDRRITFYPRDHIYTIDNVPVPSANTIISKFFPEFDTNSSIQKMRNGKNWNSSNKYWTLNDDDIKKMWREKGEKASQEGTFLHEQIEKYNLNLPHQEPPEFKHYKEFLNDNNALNPYRSEWRIFDEEYGIAGTIDLIANNNDRFEIYDWKRSKKVMNTFTEAPITYNKFQSGIGILKDISDTPYNHYCLQQSLYRYILEKNYGLTIDKMYLVVLYPEYKKHYKVETPYWKEKVKLMLETL